MDEAERLKACQEVAERMYIAGLGWNFDAIDRLTRPEIKIPAWWRKPRTVARMRNGRKILKAAR